ncbi:hypothetical protein CONPUDRAFT_138200 [Coniophora puteana RWD-64-598 SS2]|uniref:Uncharacterized protein n=1 Tax=Coniophora puteana (strain RWD-64-598) TaxID=741705 RepID=A0A5M3MJT8_CONPW|nr:uncharacterized protein CONPUDRAFT_138200 [Coniophora puteana RWD-64-598 SS2]EIW78915.1 hypothetical protein CONPUDRAFT_138200 [Coniophora puteana RWD-64-598 SS2]
MKLTTMFHLRSPICPPAFSTQAKTRRVQERFLACRRPTINRNIRASLCSASSNWWSDVEFSSPRSA